MFWVLQKNLFNEMAFTSLQAQLVAQDTPHAIVTLRPFIHEIVPDVDVTGPVFVCGSTSLGKVARAKGWTPGYFDQNLDYRLLTHHYGEHMLNADARFSKLKEAHVVDEFVFIRPVGDGKQFAGEVMTRDDFHTWRDRVVALDGESTFTTLTGDDLVVLAHPKAIHAEYRFYVVDGVVITGSMYKRGDRVHYSAQVDDRVRDFAQARADQWRPNRAFCLDVAETPAALKVIEINSINSSGFYACDMGKFVNAINALA